MKEQETRWLDCGNGTLADPVTGNQITTDVVELEGFGRIFEVYHYGNEPEQTQRLILAAPAMLAALKLSYDLLFRQALATGKEHGTDLGKICAAIDLATGKAVQS